MIFSLIFLITTFNFNFYRPKKCYPIAVPKPQSVEIRAATQWYNYVVFSDEN